MNSDYHLGLMCLAHLLISADGIVDDHEVDAFTAIRKRENVTAPMFERFQNIIKEKKDRELYQQGIEMMNRCTDEEKLRAFAMLYKLSEADGRVHVKEIKLLLFSIKLTNVEFHDVVAKANTLPPLL